MPKKLLNQAQIRPPPIVLIFRKPLRDMREIKSANFSPATRPKTTRHTIRERIKTAEEYLRIDHLHLDGYNYRNKINAYYII